MAKKKKSNSKALATISPKPAAKNGAQKGITLKLKRGERTGALGRIYFTLDARMAVSAENAAYIKKHKLGNEAIYDSENRKKHATSGLIHIGNLADVGSAGPVAAVGKTFYHIGRAVVSGTISKLSLRVTYNSLIKGVHVESRSMSELSDAEEAILNAARYLKMRIEKGQTFDGREQLFDI
jgi:hypothetical protein